MFPDVTQIHRAHNVGILNVSRLFICNLYILCPNYVPYEYQNKLSDVLVAFSIYNIVIKERMLGLVANLIKYLQQELGYTDWSKGLDKRDVLSAGRRPSE